MAQEKEPHMRPMIRPAFLAIGLALLAAPAQAQLARFCTERAALTNVTLDPRSVSDTRRPWLYSGVLTNATDQALNVVVTFIGPAGTSSMATGRSLTLTPRQNFTLPLVQWPKTMGQPSLGTVAAGVRVECP